MDRLKVKDNKDLERDVKSNGIVNTNRQGFRNGKRRQADGLKEKEIN